MTGLGPGLGPVIHVVRRRKASDRPDAEPGATRVRCLLLQLTWRWLKFQPGSALSRWFAGRVGEGKGRIRKVMAAPHTRSLLVALWRYLQTGVIPEGARLADA